MKRKGWMIGGLVAIIVLIVFGWYHYKTTEIVQEEQVQLIDIDLEQLETFTIVDESIYTFKKVEGLWVREDLQEVAYDQAKIYDYLQEVGKMHAYRTIRNVQDLAAYGIDETAYSVTLYSSQEQRTVLIGDTVESEDAYYVWDVQNEVLGIVPQEALRVVHSSINKWIDTQLVLPKAGTWHTVALEQDGEIKWRIEEVQGIWYVTSPYENIYELETERLEAYGEQLASLKKERYIGSDKALEIAYGFDEPSAVIRLGDVFTLVIGDTVDDETYIKYGNQPYIYTVDAHKVDEVLDVKPIEWLSKRLLPPYADRLAEVVFAYEDATYSVAFDGQDEASQKLVAQIGSLALHTPVAQVTLEESNPREAEVTVVYRYNDGKEIVVEYIPYDPSFYLLRINGTIEFSAEKAPVMAIIEQFKEGITE